MHFVSKFAAFTSRIKIGIHRHGHQEGIANNWNECCHMTSHWFSWSLDILWCKALFTTSNGGASYGPISLMHVRLPPGEDPRSRPTSWLASVHFAYYRAGQFIAASSYSNDDCIWSVSSNYPAILLPSRSWPSENFGEIVIEGKVWDIDEAGDKTLQAEMAESSLHCIPIAPSLC